MVDLASFKDLIDAIGGVTVNVPERILSNRFDCPYKTQARCDQWHGWSFEKGPQHMNGERALIYSRVRENQLNPADSDITRGGRQQAVLQAVATKLASVGTALRLPFIGGDLLKPLATDLSAGQFLQLGWVKFRAPSGRVLHCRLGGERVEHRRAVGDRVDRGELRRRADGHRRLGPAAAASGLGAVRAGLRRRQPDVPLDARAHA